MNSHGILFDSVKAAQEVAHALRGQWDGCNGVEFLVHDYLALKLAADLCSAEYCAFGDDCDILGNIRKPRNVLMFGFSDIVTQAITSQVAGCFNQNLHSGSKSFWQLVAKVEQDVAELQ